MSQPDALVLTRARPHPLLFAGVVDLLSRHRPYSEYGFGLLVARLKRQLQQRSGVAVLRNNIPVAYMGGVQVAEEAGRQWQASRGETMPEPDWEHGTGMVITIVVTDDRRYLRPMARSFASLYPHHTGFWKRVYTDGRPDSWRPPFHARQAG